MLPAAFAQAANTLGPTLYGFSHVVLMTQDYSVNSYCGQEVEIQIKPMEETVKLYRFRAHFKTSKTQLATLAA